jgi:uncharacterized Fe-S cluster-containing radical SAM superfamily protein
LGQELVISGVPPVNLVERVCQIVELWGMGEALDEERVIEIAGNLYGASRDAVREALIMNLREGRLKGSFSVGEGAG